MLIEALNLFFSFTELNLSITVNLVFYLLAVDCFRKIRIIFRDIYYLTSDSSIKKIYFLRYFFIFMFFKEIGKNPYIFSNIEDVSVASANIAKNINGLSIYTLFSYLSVILLVS